MKRRSTARWLLVGALLSSCGRAAAAGAAGSAGAPEPLPLSPVSESVPTRWIEGRAYVSANDLAHLLAGRRTWRADVRRLTLEAGAHRIELVLDNPFAVIDASLLRLPYPARSVNGEMLVPAAFVDTLPRDPALPRLLYDPLRDAVVVLPAGGVVRVTGFGVADSVTRLEFSADRADEVTLADRARGHFRLLFSGYFAGGLPEPPARAGLVPALRRIGSVSGSAFELTVAPEAQGFRLRRDPAGHRVTLEVARSPGEGFEEFAPEARPLPPGTPTVVIDAGHGGADAGVEVGDLSEKRLTLALARLLREELERRGIARALLTRDEDRALPAARRAEVSNHARADLFLSLHFDGFPTARSRGVTVWCPPAPPRGAPADPAPRPARRRARGRAAPAALGALPLIPWRAAALPHAARSRALAEEVRSAFVLRDLGQVRVREVMTEPLEGVDAPGIMLECGTLTSPADAERLRRPDGLRAIAATLADAVAAWRRSQ
jgi:N-acetylmuramoyl-L-alanine amidase